MTPTKRERSASPPAPSSSVPHPAPSLRHWLKLESTPPLPHPIAASLPITDRQSTFVAHACSVSAPPTASRFHAHIQHLRDKSHPSQADHEMLGWRTMTLKLGKKGLREDDFTTRSGGDDDGEKNGANTIRKVSPRQGAGRGRSRDEMHTERSPADGAVGYRLSKKLELLMYAWLSRATMEVSLPTITRSLDATALGAS